MAITTPPDRRTPARARRLIARSITVTGWLVLFLLCVVISLLAAPNLTLDPDAYFAEQRENYLRVQYFLAAHVTSGIVALLIGPFQLLARLRRRHARVHRVLGRVYVASATVLGLSGLVLVPTVYTGAGAGLAFLLLDLAMLFTTWTAVRMVLSGRYGEHRRWMIRSFSLVLAGVMLRVLMMIHELVTSAGLIEMSFETAYAAVAWLSWVPNLLIAIWITRQPTAGTRGR